MRSISGKSLWKGCGENLFAKKGFPTTSDSLAPNQMPTVPINLSTIKVENNSHSLFPCGSLFAPSSFLLRFITGRGETFMNKVFHHTPSKHFFSACCARYGFFTIFTGNYPLRDKYKLFHIQQHMSQISPGLRMSGRCRFFGILLTL